MAQKLLSLRGMSIQTHGAAHYDAFFAVEPDGGAKRVQDQPWGTPDDE